MKNYGDMVFDPISVGPEVIALVGGYLGDQDFAANTRRAVVQDLRKFAAWFSQANSEPFCIKRVTTRDVTDFKDQLRRQQGQAVNTVNRALVTLRRFFGWLVENGHAQANPVKPVKELRKQQLAPKGLERGEVRRLLREIELRQDVRANAIFSLFLYSGCRVSDLVAMELHDLMLGERSGSVVFRLGKGNKQRSVPLPLPARRALQAYLETRPPVTSANVFVGERGPLTDRGIRALCNKYSALIGVSCIPICFDTRWPINTWRTIPVIWSDWLKSSAMSRLNTTARYTKRTEGQLADATERLTY